MDTHAADYKRVLSESFRWTRAVIVTFEACPMRNSCAPAGTTVAMTGRGGYKSREFDVKPRERARVRSGRCRSTGVTR
jgi:hypothetical protein